MATLITTWIVQGVQLVRRGRTPISPPGAPGETNYLYGAGTFGAGVYGGTTSGG